MDHQGTYRSFEEFCELFAKNLQTSAPFVIDQADALLSDALSRLDGTERLTSARLFQLAFHSWRVAAAVGRAGAVGQVTALLRHSLECALYAFACARDANLERDWWSREIDASSKRRLRDRERSPLATARRHLRAEKTPLERRIWRTLDHLIDFGAHPNVFQLINLSSESQLSQEKVRISTSLLAFGDIRDQAMMHACGVSLELMDVYSLIWPDRFANLSDLQRRHGLSQQFRLLCNSHFDPVARNWQDHPPVA